MMYLSIGIGIICLLATGPFYIWNLFDAYKCVQMKNSNDFEILRKSNKDPWLAVFLSRIILGLGHIYFKKYFVGFLLVILTIFLYIIRSSQINVLSIITFLLFPFVIYNTYNSAPIVREPSKKIILTINSYFFFIHTSSLIIF